MSPDAILDQVLAAVPAPQLDLRARERRMRSTSASALLTGSTPARPGPGPMPEGLLRALDVSIARRMEGLLAGDFRSNLLGTGSELAMVRPYVPGDDVRRIDWNVTARTNEPHVRVDLAERVLVTWLVLDTSPSMQFGTADRRKADVAEGVAIALGHLATRRGNRLGVVTFGGDASRARCRRRQGRVGLVGLLAALREEPDGRAGTGSDRRSARRSTRTGALARQRSLVVVVSDFRGPRDWRRPLLELAGRHDVVAVEIRDPREQELSNVGLLWLVDPETGRQLRVDTRSRRLRERFAVAASAERARGRARCSPRSACGTSSSRPRATGCARSSSSCAGAGRDLHLAARARSASSCSRCSSLLYVWSRAAAECSSQARVREPGPAAERRSTARPGGCATCRSSCCCSRSAR